MSLYSDVLKLINRHGLLENVHRVVVGLSGGADSVCLLDLLTLMGERGAIAAEVHAAHLNHGLRGAEADADERFARELAESRGVPIVVERRDVHAARASDGGSLEAAARRERYAFLASAAEAAGAEAVAVGHNADDQIETVLHHIIRGTGLKGLRGIPLARPIRACSAVRLVRPLLRSRRSQILEHLGGRGLSCREDSSNRDGAFTRNRIRNELLPLIESAYNPAFGGSVLRLSRAARDAYDLLLDVVRAAEERCVSGAAIDLEEFARLHDAAKPFVIDAALKSAAAAPPQLDAKHYEAIDDLALSGELGAQARLPGGIVATRTRSGVTFASCEPRLEAPQVRAVLKVPGETAVSAAGVTVNAELLDRGDFDLDAFLGAKTRYDEALDFGAVAGPLVLRSRRDGDVFRPLGAGGRKKVGDFLTDLKVPARGRGRVLVVAAGEEPVWVVGHRIDDRVKITDRTRRVMVLSVRREGGI